MAEKFAFQKILGHRGAIDLDVGFVLALALFVQRAGDDFLARAAFTFDQDGGIGRCHLPDELLHLFHLRANEEQRRKFGFVGELIFEIGILFAQFRPLGDLRDGEFKLAGREGLQQIIGRADFHRFDRVLDRAEPGDDDDLDVGVGLFELLQQVEPVAVGKLEVGDDQVSRLLGLFLAGLLARTDRQHGDT